MATFTGSGSINSTFNIILEVNETGTNINDNTSTVSWVVKLQSTASYNFRTIGSTVVVNLNGSEIFNNYAQRDLGAYSTITIGSGTTTIWHNADGKKTIGCYASYTQTSGAYYTPGNMSCSGNLSLTTIPRQAKITKAVDFNDEENPTIQYSNPGNFRINARLEFAGQAIRRDNISRTGSNYTFVLTDEERKLLRKAAQDSNTLTVREVIATCTSGTTENYWSFYDKTMTIVNANPTYTGGQIIISQSPFEDINPVTDAATGGRDIHGEAAIVRNTSVIRVQFSYFPEDVKKEAKIAKYRITIGSGTAEYVVDYSADSVFTDFVAKYNGEKPVTGDEEFVVYDRSTGDYVFVPLDLYIDVYNPNSDTINIYLTDTRGNTNTNNFYYKTYRYIEYTNLFENGGSIAATRGNNGVGTNVTLGIGGKFWNGVLDPTAEVGEGEYIPSYNEIVSITYQYKKTYEALWTDGTTSIAPVTDGTNYTFSGLIDGDLAANGFDLANSYDIKVTVEDKLSTIEFTTVLSSATPGIAMHRQGISFGAPYDKNSGGVVQIKGVNIFQYIYPVGAVYISTTLVDPAVLFGGTWQRIQDRFLLAASEVYPVGSVGGEASHLLTENEMPKHRHSTPAIGNTGSAGWASTSRWSTDSGGEAVQTSYTGGGQAHNNMPPYLSVYMWERIS